MTLASDREARRTQLAQRGREALVRAQDACTEALERVGPNGAKRVLRVLVDKHGIEPRPRGRPARALDEVLWLLRKGPLPLDAIAQKLGISDSAAEQRIARLQKLAMVRATKAGWRVTAAVSKRRR